METRISLKYLRYLAAQAIQSWVKRGKSAEFRARPAITVIIRHATMSATVLCLGPRNGVELDLWNEYGFHDVEGLDLLPSRDQRIRFGDFHRLPYETSSVDIVYASHSLEHAYDDALALKEVCRVLKPGGLLYAAWPRGFVPNAHDRVDYGSAAAFVARLPRASWALWEEHQPTESRVLVRVA